MYKFKLNEGLIQKKPLICIDCEVDKKKLVKLPSGKLICEECIEMICEKELNDYWQSVTHQTQQAAFSRQFEDTQQNLEKVENSKGVLIKFLKINESLIKLQQTLNNYEEKSMETNVDPSNNNKSRKRKAELIGIYENSF